MFQWNLRRLLAEKGIKFPHRWLIERGISHARAHQLLKGTAKEIKLTQMATICRILNCSPNDLLAWQPDEGDQLQDWHALQKLIRNVNKEAAAQRIAGLNTEQLAELEKIIDQMKVYRR